MNVNDRVNVVVSKHGARAGETVFSGKVIKTGKNTFRVQGEGGEHASFLNSTLEGYKDDWHLSAKAV